MSCKDIGIGFCQRSVIMHKSLWEGDDGRKDEIGYNNASEDGEEFVGHGKRILGVVEQVSGDEEESNEYIVHIQSIGNDFLTGVIFLCMEKQDGHHAKSSCEVSPCEALRCCFFPLFLHVASVDNGNLANSSFFSLTGGGEYHIDT